MISDGHFSDSLHTNGPTDEEKATPVSDYFHQFPTRRIRKGIPKDALPRCILPRGIGPPYRPYRGARAGKTIDRYIYGSDNIKVQASVLHDWQHYINAVHDATARGIEETKGWGEGQ